MKRKNRWPWHSVAFLVLLSVLWSAFYYGTHELSTIEWTHDRQGTYSSNDWEGLLLPVGAIAGIVLGLYLSNALFDAAFYLPLAVAAAAAGLGWYDSIEDYSVPIDDAIVWIIATSVLTVIATVGLCATLPRAWRHYGYPHRLWPSRVVTLARPHSWKPFRDRQVTVSVAFRDATGNRHDVPAVIGYDNRYLPMLAIYDPNDPGNSEKLRVGASFVFPFKVDVVWRDLKRDLPAPGDDELWEDLHSSDPGVGLASRLDKVTESRRNGELTPEEFAEAKWQALIDFTETRD